MFSKVYGLETVSLRYFNVYGERQNLGGAYATVVGIFLNQILEGKSMTINGTGDQRRDFTYVGDVVRANLLASSSSKVGLGDVINIGSGKNISIKKYSIQEHLQISENMIINENFKSFESQIKKEWF